jgi:hypothetical protein
MMVISITYSGYFSHYMVTASDWSRDHASFTVTIKEWEKVIDIVNTLNPARIYVNNAF